jgi:hypothetical protein
LRDATGSYALLSPMVVAMLLLAIPAILAAEREGGTEPT